MIKNHWLLRTGLVAACLLSGRALVAQTPSSMTCETAFEVIEATLNDHLRFSDINDELTRRWLERFEHPIARGVGFLS